MSPLFWVEAYRYAETLYNKMSTNHTDTFSPHELVYRHRPRFDRVKVFGCDVYEHVDRAKLPGGTKARKGYFMGVPGDSPAGFLMYDINAGAMRTMFSATFDESLVRRGCNIRVYDKAREILTLKKKCTPPDKSKVVVEELVFGEPDDELVCGIVRNQFDNLEEASENKDEKLVADENQGKAETAEDVEITQESAMVSDDTDLKEGRRVEKNRDAQEPSHHEKGRARKKREYSSKYGHNRVTRTSTRRKAMEAELAELEDMGGDDILGRRAKNDVFNKGVFYGTVTEYVKNDEPGEEDFWQVTYEDEDTKDYHRDELVPLIEAYETEAHGLGCVRMECYAGIDGEVGQTVLSNKRVRKFRERAGGLFDIIDVSMHGMTEMEKR